MVFISYAQNYEDVMLARALVTVDSGTYIDVGAQDPDEDSVTKHFYDLGWRGLNFEPSERYHARLEAVRPRDTNLRCAVGDKPGSVTFYEAEGTGLSTIIETISDGTTEERTPHIVPMTTLDGACAAYGIDTVHFLKIDVEGAEELVLRGIGFDVVRPWIVVVEATRPNSPEPYYDHWEPLLTERGYRFVYADGLNRFYLADEHAELARHFETPPNHFDRFVRASEVQADARAEARAAANLAHHIAIIEDLDEQRTSQHAALEEHAARIGTLNGQLEERHRDLVHHLGLIEDASVRAEAQQAEIGRLTGLFDAASARAEFQQAEILQLSRDLVEMQDEADALQAEIADQRRQIAELETLVGRRARQIAFRDDKISWLTLDRDRFRGAHTTITRSLIWRSTIVLQGPALRAATRAKPQLRTDASDAPPVAPPPTPTDTPSELPDHARWLQQRLWTARDAEDASSRGPIASWDS